MTTPGFNAAASIYRSTAIYRTGSFGRSANGITVELAMSADCIENVMHASEMSYADAVWWCAGYEGGSGGGGGGGWVTPGCDPACSPCRPDEQSETGRSRNCVTSDCQPYSVTCEYGEV
jgi:hypothetical protein